MTLDDQITQFLNMPDIPELRLGACNILTSLDLSGFTPSVEEFSSALNTPSHLLTLDLTK